MDMLAHRDSREELMFCVLGKRLRLRQKYLKPDMESSVAQAETQEMTARPAHPLKYMAAWFLFRIRVSGSYFDMLAKKVAEGKSNFVNVGSN
jgi:hypothetical protein